MSRITLQRTPNDPTTFGPAESSVATAKTTRPTVKSKSSPTLAAFRCNYDDDVY